MNIKHLIIITVAVLSLLGCSAEEPATHAQVTPDQPSMPKFSCELGTSSDGHIVDVTGSDHRLYSKPDISSPQIINQKATSILGTTQYHTIDSSTRVQIQCEDGNWVKVQLQEPEWLRHVIGWVERTALLATSQSGAVRTYTEADIYWDNGTEPYKVAIVNAINRIYQENPKCTGSLDPATVAFSPSKSTPGNPVFFVTCGRGSNVSNVFFQL